MRILHDTLVDSYEMLFTFFVVQNTRIFQMKFKNEPAAYLQNRIMSISSHQSTWSLNYPTIWNVEEPRSNIKYNLSWFACVYFTLCVDKKLQ